MNQTNVTPDSTPHREDQILAAAAREFATKGYDSASMQDVANAVGLSKATLYHYFKSKEEISARLSNRTLEQLYVYVARHSAEGDARTRVTNFMVAQARFFEENYWAFVAMILLLNPAARDRNPEAISWRDRHEQQLRDILQTGVTSGELRNVDPAMTGRAVLSTLNWMIRWYRPDGPERAEDVARTYADLFLRGLEAER